jgi:hypothetical protein
VVLGGDNIASFKVEGLTELVSSLDDIASIPDSVIEDMLNAEAEVVVAAQKASIRKFKLVDTGKLEASIRAFSKKSKGRPYVLVYPDGIHKTRNRKKITKAYKRSKSGRTYTYGGDKKEVRNSEVGFVAEYGVRGVSAKPWMRTANEKAADEAVAAAAKIYDKHLKSKKL